MTAQDRTAVAEAPAHTAASAGFSTGYRHYILVILTAMYVTNYLDRQILNVLLPPIKAEFHVSDAFLGLLAGPTFALFYATLGIPIARLADRSSRRNIIAVSMGLFSLMTVVCGTAAQFWQLLIARVFTGVGEAGTGPSAQAVISDLYPPERRAAAQSFYSAGLNIGLLIAAFAGGWIAQHYGWREAFLAAGAPGLLLAILVMLTVKEPPRGHSEQLSDHMETPDLRTVARFLWSQRSFRWVALGAAMTSFGGYGATAFMPAFLVRSHHLTLEQVGVIFAGIAGIGGWAGTFLSGVVADRLGRQDARWYMYVPICAALLALPFQPVFYLAQSTTVAIVAAIIPAAMGAVFLGPCVTMTQGLVPLRMRATASALFLFILNIIGLGLGPQTVGLLSTLLQPVLGADSLRYALLVGMVSGTAGAVCYWRAAKTLREDLARVARLF
ncbi:MAG: MFS transporter [Alphaproteobacteria bacterium]|nr:MFS transporter [Alphaproteobacteria bacterium]MDE2013643.1 MFS transporter [Alphaproteobacteria bacterium]MDE2350325.1 MFS transporter [Alphaproteobacteria bacterium]